METNIRIVLNGDEDEYLVMADDAAFGNSKVLYRSPIREACHKYICENCMPPIAFNVNPILYRRNTKPCAGYEPIGHLTFDFGSDGHHFHHSWWEHTTITMHDEPFRNEFNNIIFCLRITHFRTLDGAMTYARWHGKPIAGEGSETSVFAIASKNYLYCFRIERGAPCSIYCYRKQEALAKAQ